MAKLTESSNVKFAKILADGKLHISCDENEKGAIKREVEKTDGEKKVYIEKIYNEVEGKITSLEIKDGDFGNVLYIGLDDEIVITVGTSSNFGTDLLKKIPNIDTSKEITVAPYSFTGDKGNSIKGVTVSQEGNKLVSFFQDKNKKNINGLPEIDEATKPERTAKTAWKKFWNNYFDSVEEFLVDYVTKNNTIEYVEEDTDTEDIKKEF